MLEGVYLNRDDVKDMLQNPVLRAFANGEKIFQLKTDEFIDIEDTIDLARLLSGEEVYKVEDKVDERADNLAKSLSYIMALNNISHSKYSLPLSILKQIFRHDFARAPKFTMGISQLDSDKIITVICLAQDKRRLMGMRCHEIIVDEAANERNV